ncbi:hypothetical protein AUC61_23345 [Pseudomonas sp. S25]|uniref:Uncharacterized protein n=1 Tax=Pseudomonas maioricensis TaxID=1766623 RepID=A0ABS9ZPH5_9PSED|nr:hypothetical protein [Pseudomonas sp. S25]
MWEQSLLAIRLDAIDLISAMAFSRARWSAIPVAPTRHRCLRSTTCIVIGPCAKVKIVSIGKTDTRFR